MSTEDEHPRVSVFEAPAWQLAPDSQGGADMVTHWLTAQELTPEVVLGVIEGHASLNKTSALKFVVMGGSLRDDTKLVLAGIKLAMAMQEAQMTFSIEAEDDPDYGPEEPTGDDDMQGSPT